MKTGIRASTFDICGYGRWAEKTYIKLKEHGFSCSDFDMMDTETVIYKDKTTVVRDLMLKEKELAESAGVEITQVHGPWCWPTRDNSCEGLRERMDEMKKSIYYTSVLGAKNWVIHPIMPYGTEDKNTETASKTIESNLNFFRELLPTARQHDVTICLENMPFRNFSLSTPEEILGFVNEINDSNFKICLDTGHVATFADLVLAQETIRLGEKIRALHVHDSRAGMDLHLMPYYGITDWPSFMKALKDINFDGAFCLETAPPAGLCDDVFETAGRLLGEICGQLVSMCH